MRLKIRSVAFESLIRLVDSQQQDASYTDILSDEKNSPETKFTSNVKFNTHSTISNEATDHTTDSTDTSASGNLFESNANNEDINVRCKL